MNLEPFCSVSRSSQKWVGTLLFLSSRKKSLIMQQDDSPPSQIWMAMVAHKKLNLESSICAFIQGIYNPNLPYMWSALLGSFSASKTLPKGDKPQPKLASLSYPKENIIHPPSPLIHAPWGACNLGRPTQGFPRSGTWIELGSQRVGQVSWVEPLVGRVRSGTSRTAMQSYFECNP